LWAACILYTIPPPVLAEAAPSKRSYDLPAGEAERTLKLFSQQSGLGIIVGSKALAGLRTHAVRGEMTAHEALARMLAGTGLVATQDDQNRAFAIRREDTDPNG